MRALQPSCCTRGTVMKENSVFRTIYLGLPFALRHRQPMFPRPNLSFAALISLDKSVLPIRHLSCELWERTDEEKIMTPLPVRTSELPSIFIPLNVCYLVMSLEPKWVLFRSSYCSNALLPLNKQIKIFSRIQKKISHFKALFDKCNFHYNDTYQAVFRVTITSE